MNWLEPWSAALLVLTCLWGPWLSIQSARRLGHGPLPISRRRFFVQTLVIQLMLLGVAVMASRQTGVPLVVTPPRAAGPWLVSAGLVIVGLVLLRWRWSARTTAEKERIYSIVPHEAREYPSYLTLCLAAGICEEVAYRGMLFAILWYLTGSRIAAVLIASVAFALAHSIQGRRGVVAIFIIALAAHGLVLFAQSLLPVMAAHALYDAIAGWLIPRLYERDALLRQTNRQPAGSFEAEAPAG
jgi:membrane protease YdiL (CAAX protease family)